MTVRATPRGKLRKGTAAQSPSWHRLSLTFVTIGADSGYSQVCDNKPNSYSPVCF